MTEGFIHDPNTFVHGETLGQHITINPAVSVVDTVFHECLHRLYPAWSEGYVRNRTTYLMRRMSDAQIQAAYDQYQRIVKKKARRPRKTTPAPLPPPVLPTDPPLTS